MMQRMVYDYYGLYVEEQFQVGRYTGFATKDANYLFVPESQENTSLWEEKLQWAQVMRQGDQTVALFIPSIQKNRSITLDGEKQLLFQLYVEKTRDDGTEEYNGSELATFHNQGMVMFPPVSSELFVQRWSEWWEKRLEQLENWYQSVKTKPAFSLMDRWFIKTFPYYLGMTENAIQCLKAIPVHERTEEAGCISHFCYTPAAWVTIAPNTRPIKLPSDWLYDHPTRDIAEWMRYAMEQGYSHTQIENFVQSYERHNQVTSFGWDLIIGRLLFPYYYLEQMEQTYLRENIGTMEETLYHLEQSWEKEGTRLEQIASLKEIFPYHFQKLPDWLLGRGVSFL
ncbi:spore coat protein YutH [Salibacterium salarium]|uniref:Spore coat protein YutH n=1 Tax=Salibacterium salarium TaxID=284579 RepID=A0A3R9QV78_9BACI|nr:spore coat protein YutH [Salibacterium salarium]RSL34135.1 spore coat protein YutH [Salibacterium salarium]